MLDQPIARDEESARRGPLVARLALPSLAVFFVSLVVIRAWNQPLVDYDESIFLDVARNLRESGVPLRSLGPTGAMFFDHTPLFPYVLAGAGVIFGEQVLAYRLLCASLALASVAMVYATCRRRHGIVAGGLAAAILAFNFFFIALATSIRPAMLFCFFMAATFFCLDRSEADPRSAPKRLATGLAVAGLVMTRELGLALWGVLLLYLLVRTKGWTARAVAVCWVGVPTLVFLAGWLGYAYQLDSAQLFRVFGRWMGSIDAGPASVDPRTLVANREWLSTLVSTVLGPKTVLLLLLAIPIGLAQSRRTPRPETLAPALGYFVAAGLASLVIDLKEPRHALGMVVAASLATGLLVDWRPFGSSFGRPATVAVLAVLVVIVNPVDSWRKARGARSHPRLVALRQAGIFLGATTGPDEVLLAVRRASVVGYYARRRYRFLYTEPLSECLERLSGARFLVVDPTDFRSQSEEETARLFEYIDAHFQPVPLPTDEHSDVRLMARRPP